jgi:hypothetical protein
VRVIASRWPALARIDAGAVAFLGGVVAVQLVLYHFFPAVPSHDPAGGWEHWWDQSQYLRSARAFLELDLSEANHWYPIGYSLLAVPFLRLFADPFFVPNLVAFIVFAGAFHRYFKPMIGTSGVAIAFFGALLFPLVTLIPFPFPNILWMQFVMPWNTIPIAAIFMCLLCMVRDLRPDDSFWKDFLTGVLVGAVVAIKPAELLPLSIIGAGWLIITLRTCERAWRRLGAAAAGTLIVGAPVLALSFRIHGGISSPYTRVVDSIGMQFGDFGERATNIFLDAGPSYGDAHSALIQVLPWFPLLAPLALVGAVLRPRMLLAPVALCVAEMFVYLAYNDFSPLNFLHFHLIHYLVWTFPVIAAAGMATALSARHYPKQLVACGVAVAIGCGIASLRVTPKLVPNAGVEWRSDAKGRHFDIRFAAPVSLDTIDFVPSVADKGSRQRHPAAIEVDGKAQAFYRDYRIIDLPDRTRVIFQHPLHATRVSLTVSGIGAADAIDVEAMRLPLRFGRGPWADHTADVHAQPD